MNPQSIQERAYSNHALLNQIRSGQAKFLLQFGGQGASYYSELNNVYRERQLELGDFFQCTFATLEQEYVLAAVEHPEWYPAGYDLQAWLQGGEAPSQSQFTLGVYSVPLIFVTQVAHYLRLVSAGLPEEELLDHAAAAIGHSQGLHPALLIARRLKGKAFLSGYAKLLRLLFRQGYRAREADDAGHLGADLLDAYHGETAPAPMASVQGKTRAELESLLEAFHVGAPEAARIEIGLKNGPRSFVLSGDVASLLQFRVQAIAKDAELEGCMQFLPVSGPYHSSYMETAVRKLQGDAERIGLELRGADLTIPVIDSSDGSNLQHAGDLTHFLARASMVLPVDWEVVLHSTAQYSFTHALGFGPGDGILGLSRRAMQSRGVVQIGVQAPEALEQIARQPLRPGRSWADYAPKRAQLSDGTPFLWNEYTRYTGRPPVFGGGMTPTTVEIDMVVAAAKTGRIVEWAGGGQVTEAILRERLDRMCAQLEPGQGIVMNLLYLDAYLWNLQYPLVKQLRAAGYPIEGVTISAGVPEREEGVRILDELHAAGVWLNSFKPGTNAQIEQALAIADARPQRKLILQVEGGAAGGHHSWENLEDLIRANYHRIRARENVLLAVGGGIHTPEQAARWLCGTWNPEETMPVDAAFLGTRLMAAKEAATSSSVKAALVKLNGSQDWSNGRNGSDLGGVASGRSGLGADIYYANNHWARTSAYLEKLLAGKSGAEAEAAIAENRATIIEAINQTAKPYFGDLERMTYFQMLARFAELVCPGERIQSPEGQWPAHPFVDPSFRTRWEELIRRAEARFAREAFADSVLNAKDAEPCAVLEALRAKHPEVAEARLLPEDRRHFFEVCRRPGKPVNFIPVLDESLIKWYRSDSLWYSHCEGVDQDACAWIPGPVAVASIQRANEPVTEILTGFEAAIYAAAEESALQLDIAEFDRATNGGPATEDAKPLRKLCLQSGGSLCDFLETRTVVEGLARRELAIPALLQPAGDRRLKWELDGAGRLTKLRLVAEIDGWIEMELTESGDEIRFNKFVRENANAVYVRRFRDTRRPYARFIELTDRALASRAMYAALWNIETSGKAQDGATPETCAFSVEASFLHEFYAATKERRRGFSPTCSIVAVWQPMVRALFSPEAAGDVLQLVHLFQEFEWKPAYHATEAGELLQGEASLARVKSRPGGKEIVVRGVLRNAAGDELAYFRAGFWIRGESATGVRHLEYPGVFRLRANSEAALAVLCEQPYLQLENPAPRRTIEIRPEHARIQTNADGESEWIVQGPIFQAGRRIGAIDLEWSGLDDKSPLERLIELFPEEDAEIAHAAPHRVFSEEDRAPHCMQAYARASRDSNPIHTDPKMAELAGFSAPIVHGMWTAARVADAVIRNVAGGEAWRLLAIESRFLSPLQLNERFFIEARHVSNANGARVLALLARAADGREIYSGRARVAPLPTAYVFTGQGSQATGMGMRFYESHAAARKLWDRAERLTTEQLGFSILHIVRENPTGLRVNNEAFRHPNGVLNLTQFTQVGLVAKAMADWAVLRENGLLAEKALFAGHSLGEYAALASQGILPLEAVLKIVYHRGMTMQNLVERDAEGRSPYGMTVVLGNRKAGLTEERIIELVRASANESGLDLEVVNHNIRDRQYSVTGRLPALELLEAKLRALSGGHKTCIRIPGIDVPFHSRLLEPGVAAFREVLQSNLTDITGLEALEDCYIPNLVARPFATDADFLQAVLDRTESPRIAELLAHRQAGAQPDDDFRRTLLVELLAYQFARPVLWIQTQEYIFGQAGVRRMIDIGARGDLAGMAKQTLRQLPLARPVEVMHIEENEARALHLEEDAADRFAEYRAQHNAGANDASDDGEAPAAGSDRAPVGAEVRESKNGKASSPTGPAGNGAASTPRAKPVAAGDETTPTAAAHSGAVPDANISAWDGLRAVLAWKAELRPDEIQSDDTIEAIFGGNSSKRNQALADLGAEFQTTELEGAQEKQLADVAAMLEKTAGYKGPGPYLRSAFEAMLRERAPRGFGREEVLRHMRERRSMPENLSLLATMELPLYAREGASTQSGVLSPNPITKRFSANEQMEAWLDAALDAFASARGRTLPYPQAGGAGEGGAVVDSAALSELEARYFGVDGVLPRLLRRARAELSGEDPFRALLVQDERALSGGNIGEFYRREHGRAYEAVLQSRFAPEKVVTLDNALQWAKKNLYREYWEIVGGTRMALSAELKRQAASFGSDGEVAAMLDWLERKARPRNAALADELAQAKARAQANGGRARYVPLHGPFRASVSIQEDGRLDVRETMHGDATALADELLLDFEGKMRCELQSSPDEGDHFVCDEDATIAFHKGFLNEGLDFSGRCALVTGAGPNSIALEIVQNLLAGGATVILTTSSYTDARLEAYKRVYQQHAGAGASLVIAPLSQGALDDIEKLIGYLFDAGYVPDLLIPFGAVGDERDIGATDGDSLASVRVMLLGVQALAAGLAAQYRKRYLQSSFETLLPLSPNHGTFGRDGLYAESKLALEVMLRKWHSEYEQWGRYCRLRACRIGWVRSTGLMELNDVVAPDLEERYGVRTFHRREMGALLTALIAFGAKRRPEPLLAEFTGGLGQLPGLRGKLAKIREDLLQRSERKREERELRRRLQGDAPEATLHPPLDFLRSDLERREVAERSLAAFADSPVQKLEDLVCIVGYGEVGPGGGARTRWELERGGELSMEAAVELAWTMGLIEYRPDKGGSGWFDRASGEAVPAHAIAVRYAEAIQSGTGIRIVNPEVCGFDPLKRPVYAEVVLEEDFHIPVAGEEEGRQFQAALPDETDLYFAPEKEAWFIRRRAGSSIRVLKSVKLDRYAAGQIPDGWDPERYGVARDLVKQVDRVTLFNLIATAEAFVQAGMEPEELYRYIHPSMAGTTVGGGLGGTSQLGSVYTDQLLDRRRQNDALQETLINVTTAYAVSSYLGSTGPIQTPVAACATGGVSLDMGAQLIQSGRAQFVMAGGFDDLSPEGMLGFGDMEATARTGEMLARGIEPARISRPNDSRRGGFVESMGGGALLLARGDLAYRMGLPVYGVVAATATHSDGLHVSIPAPGQGLLGVAAESPEASQHREASEARAGDLAGGSLLRRALQRFGLTADDIGVIYKHDTSTKANDINENRLHNTILRKLGRSAGNPAPVVSQKSYTGHSKAGAACWQMIGLLQCMQSGIVPGNRNLQNADSAMNSFEHILFTDETIRQEPGSVRCGVFSTLGFGHVGALGLLVNGAYFERCLDDTEREVYRVARAERLQRVRERVHGMRLGSPGQWTEAPAFVRRTEKPHADDHAETEFLLNPEARLDSASVARASNERAGAGAQR